MFVGEVTTGKKMGVASEMEYLIKWKGKSYVHNTWHTGKASLRDVLMEIMVWLISFVPVVVIASGITLQYRAINLHVVCTHMHTHTTCTCTCMYMYH